MAWGAGSAAGGHGAQEEGQVGGALGEAAHEVGKPVSAERHGQAHAIALLHELRREGGADAVEHLKLETALFRKAQGFGERDNAIDDARVVRGDGRVPLAGIEQSNVTAFSVMIDRLRSGDMKLTEQSVVAVDEVGLLGTRQGLELLRLREKLGKAANAIETVRGFGYRLRE